MKFALDQIRNGNSVNQVEFEDDVDVSELETMNNDIRKISPAHVHVLLTADKDEIFASLTIKGEMILPCARTLVDVPYSYEVKRDEVYTTSPFYTEEDEENEIHQIEGEVLDLMPQIKENIALAIPYRVFSKEANPEGAAPTAGDGWAFVEEKPKENTIDPRLQKLEFFLNKKKKENE